MNLGTALLGLSCFLLLLRDIKGTNSVLGWVWWGWLPPSIACGRKGIKESFNAIIDLVRFVRELLKIILKLVLGDGR